MGKKESNSKNSSDQMAITQPDLKKMPTTKIGMKMAKVVFPDLQLAPNQLSAFRGSIAAWAGLEHDAFHNHAAGTKLHYRYPKIQYKLVDGYPCIIGINEGVEPLTRQLFEAKEYVITLNGKYVSVQNFSIEHTNAELQLTDSMQTYYLNLWLPLNKVYHEKWKATTRLADKALLLENRLAAHLLSFAKGINWRLPDKSLNVALLNIYKEQPVRLHNEKLLAFSVRYQCNLLLPDHIGIGRRSSIGFGIQHLA